MVATALGRAGIRAVLTGGACASLHSDGAVISYDLDFVLQSSVNRDDLDAVMLSIGFHRKGRHYANRSTKFYVDFPRGPLGVGADTDVRTTTYRVGRLGFRILSATDSCRDRLAAFYHWNDRQSLAAAVEIARRHRVNLDSMREWSRGEGAEEGFNRFLRLLRPGRGGTSS